jgi:hypothetical protein
MSHVMKLSLAVGLAFAAAALNAMWLSAEKRPASFVAAKDEIKAGSEINEGLLTDVPVPGDPDTLRESLIPFANRSLLFGMKAPRNYTRGDVFFQRDIQAPLEPVQFETLGPFRLISVGEKFKQAGDGPDEGQIDASGNNVTIAVSANYDEQTRRLLEIIDPNRRAEDETRVVKIVAVQVIPKEKETSLPPADAKNIVYQTVSLQGIESVPRVLLQGDVIQFVIPKSRSL